MSIIHLPENTKKFGYGCVGYVRNIGLKNHLVNILRFVMMMILGYKINLNYKSMKLLTGCKMSSTGTLAGKGFYNY